VAPQQPGTHYMLAMRTVHPHVDPAGETVRASLSTIRNCAAQWKLGQYALEQHQDSAEALVQIKRPSPICQTSLRPHDRGAL